MVKEGLVPLFLLSLFKGANIAGTSRMQYWCWWLVVGGWSAVGNWSKLVIANSGCQRFLAIKRPNCGPKFRIRGPPSPLKVKPWFQGEDRVSDNISWYLLCRKSLKYSASRF